MDKVREVVRQLVVTINNLDKTQTANTPKIGRQSSELWFMYALDDGKPHSETNL